MCLTIPGKVKKIDGRKAVIEDSSGEKTVDISLMPKLKVGDWVLYVNQFGIKKISSKDAKEILYLLESAKEIDFKKLSTHFREIIEASRKRDLTKDEIIYLLNTEGDEKEALFSEANTVRKEYIKDFICIHGIIEFSNYCKNDCFYCGLRAQNKESVRCRMSADEIVETAEQAVKEKGYKLLVLQSGEDLFYTDDMLAEIVRKIKEKCRVFIFMSVGERSRDCYRKLREAGTSGVLFRFETSNPKLFRKIHPKGKNLENRFELLKYMRKLGFYVATGSIIGLPGQTLKDLADDILNMNKYAHMISMGPFVPSKGTPFEGEPHGDPEINFKMIAILRLIKKNARIPVVTALETLAGEGGRKRAFLAGANSLMFNLTPAKYRPHYNIYDNKFHQAENLWERYGLFKYEESYGMLEDRMKEALETK